jgi:predicted TIM-barrel fold metal-dependent hydrolase
MTGFLTAEERRLLRPAETALNPTPIPTQVVSSDEFVPPRQTKRQREVEARTEALGSYLAARQGVSRRTFFASASGMAAAFLVMNDVYGAFFDVTAAEAASPELADERADALAAQYVFDGHTHFLRDDTKLNAFVRMRQDVADLGWNRKLTGKQTIEDLKYDNYVKEIFLDSDTKVAILSSAPSDSSRDWFLTNEMMAEARQRLNRMAGSRRLLSHMIFTPGQRGWLDEIDKALSLKPESAKGYTIGDNIHKETSRHPWRMDDEKLTYKAYEKFKKAGLRNVCVHKGLFPPSLDARYPSLRPYVDVSDVGKAARDWPELNFIIYHSGYRQAGGEFVADAEDAWRQVQRTGRNEWVSDLAEIPARYGVKNVYGDIGQTFAATVVANPALAAFLLGTLIEGLGADHVVWGSDALWTGSPQWQIEGLRRLEIPADMQEKYGFEPLGPADGKVKAAILGGNSARLYGLKPRAAQDTLAMLRDEYRRSGGRRSNLRYGYVAV